MSYHIDERKVELLKAFIAMIEQDKYMFLNDIDDKKSIENILNDDTARAVIEQVKGILFDKSLYERATIEDVKAILNECILYYFELIENEIARNHLIPHTVRTIPEGNVIRKPKISFKERM